MAGNPFSKATRTQAKARVALVGPSGSGKTWNALEIATALVGEGSVAVIDTEHGSASLYSDRFAFDVLNLDPPYTWEKYEEAMDAAVRGGYSVLIIDSISHLWAGEGGLLDEKSKLDSRGGNQFSNWRIPSEKHNRFLGKILSLPLHVIATMRSKSEYVLEKDERGRERPRKVGMAPVQRDGVEYEFTTVFSLDMSHNAVADKDRTGLFSSDVPFSMKQVPSRVAEWLSGGEPAPAQPNAGVQESQKESGTAQDGNEHAASGEAVEDQSDEASRIYDELLSEMERIKEEGDMEEFARFREAARSEFQRLPERLRGLLAQRRDEIIGVLEARLPDPETQEEANG